MCMYVCGWRWERMCISICVCEKEVGGEEEVHLESPVPGEW